MHGSEFSELRAFVAVAERRSFSRAAGQLGLGASTISQTVRALEERLGVRLFNRTTRSVSLTDAGERLLARVRPAMARVNAILEDVKDVTGLRGWRGCVRLCYRKRRGNCLMIPSLRLSAISRMWWWISS